MRLTKLWSQHGAWLGELVQWHERLSSAAASNITELARSTTEVTSASTTDGSPVRKLSLSESDLTLRRVLSDSVLLHQDKEHHHWDDAAWLYHNLISALPRQVHGLPWYRRLTKETREEARHARARLAAIPLRKVTLALSRFRDRLGDHTLDSACTEFFREQSKYIPTLLDELAEADLGDLGLYVPPTQVELLLDGSVAARRKLAERQQVLLLQNEAIAFVGAQRRQFGHELGASLAKALGINQESSAAHAGFQQAWQRLAPLVESATLAELVPASSDQLTKLATSVPPLLPMLKASDRELEDLRFLVDLPERTVGGDRAGVLFIAHANARQPLEYLQSRIEEGKRTARVALASQVTAAPGSRDAQLGILSTLTGVPAGPPPADAPDASIPSTLKSLERGLAEFDARVAQVSTVWGRVHASKGWGRVADRSLQFVPIDADAQLAVHLADRILDDRDTLPKQDSAAAREYCRLVHQLASEWSGIPSVVRRAVQALPSDARPASVWTRLESATAAPDWAALSAWARRFNLKLGAGQPSPATLQHALPYLNALRPAPWTEVLHQPARDDLHRLRVATDEVLAAEATQAKTVLKAFEKVQTNRVSRELTSFPLEKLRDITQGRLHLQPLIRAGLRSVADVCGTPLARLEQLPGMGYRTAAQVKGAADRLAQSSREELGIRIDLDPDDRDVTALLEAVRNYLMILEFTTHQDEILGWGARYGSLLDAARGPLLLRATDGGTTAEIEACPHAELVRHTAAQLRTMPGQRPDVWEHFQHESPRYYDALSRLSGIPIDIEAEQGHLPTEIANSVRQFRLNRDLLTVSLREYQVFGAKYALVQRRTLIGDEMGLGKTIQALAVAAHLAAAGKRAFLVICPVSVLYNWMRETRQRTKLTPYLLHGADRLDNLRQWERQGGVAITSYGYAKHLADRKLPIDALIVDEAHYVKGPTSQRTQAVRHLAARASWVLFMTGTPLENRLSEFTEVTRPLNNEIAQQLERSLDVLTPKRFRDAVSQVYLRRNAQDVLTELPEVVEVMEEVELTKNDHRRYLRALSDRDFQGMRRAAFASDESAKMTRLRQLVAEAAENDRKVVVFTYFLDVASKVVHELGRAAHGPITGQTPAAARQGIIDLFGAAKGPAVLVAQIVAGGTGLNIQAASVVILCEPQLKPTLETQAIGRVHRMGQLRSVQVHRLVAVDTVDARILDILATKRKIFDDYARHSAIVDVAPESIDVSEKQLADQVIAEERARHLRDLQAMLGAPDGSVSSTRGASPAHRPTPSLPTKTTPHDDDDDDEPDVGTTSRKPILAEVSRRGTTPDALRRLALGAVVKAQPTPHGRGNR